MEDAIGQKAEAAFENFHFGENVEVTDVGTWEYTSPGMERSRTVYVETEREDDGPAPRWKLSFTVRFNEQGDVVEVYALDEKGQFWGESGN